MIGETISHYRILEKLGEGGMGVVYRAQDLHLDRFVAVKFLHEGCVADDERRRRFAVEAKAASALSHPNIITIHDIDSERGICFIVMEYIAGKALSDLIGPQGLPLESALNFAAQTASALAAAHGAGIIHRDLKPANVMVGENGVVKVLDFGLAKLIEDSPADAEASTRTAGLTGTGAIVGTAAYMSPEQAAGKRVDVRTDVFSFGSMLYEMLTGRKAFHGDSIGTTIAALLRDDPPPVREVRPDAPASVTDIVARCLQKNSEGRFSSGAELQAAIAACRDRLSRRGGPLAGFLRPRIVVAAVTAMLILAAGATWFGLRASRIRRAREVALPQVERLIDDGKTGEALDLIRQAARYIPDDSALEKLRDQCAVVPKLHAQPPDAEIYWKEYMAIDAPWKKLGQPDMYVPRAYLRWKFAKEGYEPQELAFFPGSPLQVDLYRQSPEPGMVRIPAGAAMIRVAQPVQLGEFWLDRYEVTNRQFKAFVDRGGYREKRFWKQPFTDNGRNLSWDEAMARFRDSTGRPGPAYWELGAYPEGQDDYPVTGVSWYEAAAYSEFVGKSLPTIYQWRRAAPDRHFGIVFLSNFGGKGPAQVGSNAGLAPFGNYDMAGNAKEWCWNETGGLRYIIGGAWNDNSYSFGDPDAQPPFSRTVTSGFRCAKNIAPVPAPLQAEFRVMERDYTREKPVADNVYKAYRDLYAYDRTDLEASVAPLDDGSKLWRREKVTFKSAYGERMAAILFLPRNGKPPFQTVVYFPGSSAYMQRGASDSINPAELDFILRSGRALVQPVYWGTYERGKPVKSRPAATSVMWRDLVINGYKDLGRTIDYLETRTDVDRQKLAYYGLSSGATFGTLYLAVDDRFRAAVFMSGAMPFELYRPEVDPLNFAPRVRTPVLMLNGKYDFTFPLQSCQLPLLHLLGTPGKDKKHVLYETAHTVPRTPELIREILDWLDRYLGSVE